LASFLLLSGLNLRLFALKSHMKTPAKRNPLAWMAALLMGVVLWGCKTDHDESIKVTDNNLVALCDIERAIPAEPALWTAISPNSELLSP
jgi:hypothetical protein